MYRIAIDRGGTFTDVFAICPENRIVTLKLLSKQPSEYSDAPFDAIKRILLADGKDIQNDAALLSSVRMGTTVATNALLEHKGVRVAVVLTKGFKDIFRIGNQSREDIFELNLSDPFLLYEDVVEVDERITLYSQHCEVTKDIEFKDSISDDKVAVLKQIDRDVLRKQLQIIYDKGIDSLAVALVHSYIYPDHELIVEEVAKQIGFKHITLSSNIMKMIRYVPRGWLVC